MVDWAAGSEWRAVQKLLIIRLSAMGDVVLTVPVVDSLARQYRDLRITVLTKKSFADMFHWMPGNVEVMGVNLDNYKGVGGLERLCRQLRAKRFDAVADLHDVLRSKYLRMRLRMGGLRVATIDKGRSEKKALFGHGSDAKPLPHVTERYHQVFQQLGYDFEVDFQRLFLPQAEDFSRVHQLVGRKSSGEHWVGIAPFAAHAGKVYPLSSMRRVAEMLAEQGSRVFLFGAGEQEGSELAGWESLSRHITSVCGRMGGLHNELLLMSQLDSMVAMDSANMHLAALVGTRVVSIWGATHPKTGFQPWHQSPDDIVQMDDLSCRPCSIYGKKPCRWGDYRCLTKITPQQIVEKIKH